MTTPLKWTSDSVKTKPTRSSSLTQSSAWGTPVGGGTESPQEVPLYQNMQGGPFGGSKSTLLDSYLKVHGFPFFKQTIQETELVVGVVATDWDGTHPYVEIALPKGSQETSVDAFAPDSLNVRAYFLVPSECIVGSTTTATTVTTPVPGTAGIEFPEDVIYRNGGYDFSKARIGQFLTGQTTPVLHDKLKGQWFCLMPLSFTESFARFEIGLCTSGIDFNNPPSDIVSYYTMSIPRTEEAGIHVTNLVSGSTPRDGDWRNFYPYFATGDYAFMGYSDHENPGTFQWYILETFQDLRGILHTAEITDLDDTHDYFKARIYNKNGSLIGSELTVQCHLTEGETEFSKSIPSLVVGDKVDVYYGVEGNWYCTTTFHSDKGTVYSAITQENSFDVTDNNLLYVQLINTLGEGTGTPFDVTCTITGETGVTALSDCMPKIPSGKVISVYRDNAGVWRPTFPFMSFTECETTTTAAP